jgi:hypothetical protein
VVKRRFRSAAFPRQLEPPRSPRRRGPQRPRRCPLGPGGPARPARLQVDGFLRLAGRLSREDAESRSLIERVRNGQGRGGSNRPRPRGQISVLGIICRWLSVGRRLRRLGLLGWLLNRLLGRRLRFFFFTVGFAGAAGVSGAALGAAGAGAGAGAGAVWANTGTARKAVAIRAQTSFLIIAISPNQPRELHKARRKTAVGGYPTAVFSDASHRGGDGIPWLEPRPINARLGVAAVSPAGGLSRR